MKKTIALSCIVLLSGCSVIPPEAYSNRGDPESQLDISSEVVNMNLASPSDVSQLSKMVSQDPPTRAELRCGPSDSTCSNAKNIFDQYGIPVKMAGGSGGATLIYERVIARDCENRFIDNSINPYNLHPPTWGCSVRGNTVQMVSDKRQFVSPNLVDFQDGDKAAQAYKQYEKSSSEQEKAQQPSWMVQSGAGSQ